MRTLGLDVGDKRIGVALSDPEGILASPLKVIENTPAAAQEVAGIVQKNEVGAVVVGLPRTMSGELGEQAQKVSSFVEELKRLVAVPVETRDERLTTVLARRLMRESPRRSKGKVKPPDDAAAAAIILQAYLEEKRPASGQSE